MKNKDHRLVAILKAEYANLSTKDILQRLNLGLANKDSSAAYSEVLKERNVYPINKKNI